MMSTASCMCLGQLACTTELIHTKTSFFGIVRDFNANSHGSPFFTELTDFCSENGLILSDVQLLGTSSRAYTFVSAAHGSFSWIDHCVCSPALHSVIQSIKIHYDLRVVDHMPIAIEFALQPTACTNQEPTLALQSKPNWRTASAEIITEYNHLIREQLQPLWLEVVRELDDNCNPNCVEATHLQKLSNCYRIFTESVATGGRHCIQQRCIGPPKHPKCIPGWNQLVKTKHELARKAFLLWRSHNSPREGAIATLMRQTRLSFKYALRRCKRDQERQKLNLMENALLNQEPARFWTLIKQQLGAGTPLPPSFGGVRGNSEISELWKNHFKAIFNDASCSSDVEVFDQVMDIPVPNTPPIGTQDVCNAIAKLKSGKSPGWDNISTDHLMNLQPDILATVAVLFNCMINHSDLPAELVYSLLVPLVKDKAGPLDDKSNYRAIALSTTLSKVLELVLIERLEPFLHTSDAQFGFKVGHSTTHAAYCLKETVNYYTSKGSPVYSCFLDASKAFDRVCHSKLFGILSRRGVPTPYLKLLLKWYKTQQMGVKWADRVSESSVENGVRQGGNLSPLLFNVYIDELLLELRKLPVGCHIGKCSVNVLAYADDIVLLSPTREGLQALVEKCEMFAISKDINFNVRKTVCMLFNPQKPYGVAHLSCCKPPSISLNGHNLVWVEKFKYLGHVLASNLSDGPDMCRVKRSLYYSVNMICARVGHANRNILIKLFRAYCTNMYGCELWDTAGERKAFNDLCIAYHSCIKKLVKLPRWTRNHDLCQELGLLTSPMLVASRKLMFQQRLLTSDNSIIQILTDSEIGTRGITAKSHFQIQQQYGLMVLDLLSVGKADIRNIFAAHLDRFVRDRLLREDMQDPG